MGSGHQSRGGGIAPASGVSETLSPLSNDEVAVLSIAAYGQSMIAIGRWEEPTKSLVRRGFLRDATGDLFNCYITDAGRAAIEAYDADMDREIRQVLEKRQEAMMLPKEPKDRVQYGKATDPNDKCRECIHYLGQACEKVQGAINPDYWCMLFERIP